MAFEFILKAFSIVPQKILNEHGLGNDGKVQSFIDSECLRLCERKIPKDQSILIKSGIANTVVGSGQIKWSTPYARRLYYHPEYNFQGAPDRGAYWFERMKQQHKSDILKGAAKIAGGKTK